jgi:hypothetical protein
MYFAKHETFHIRDGWLYKGMKAVQQDENIFLADDAPERLGLGKNMVRALRFWMQATGLTIEDFSSGKKAQFLTHTGGLVWEYDPYLELEGTLWLLHYQLISSRELATTWYWFFNQYVPVTFAYQDFSERLRQWINIQPPEDSKSVADSSLRKDFDCLLRTYLPGQRGKSPEDVMESPFTSLRLLSAFTEYDEETQKSFRMYRLEASSPQTIPPQIFLYVLLKRQEEERAGADQVGLNTALREPLNVGRTFNVGMLALEDLLMRLENIHPEWAVRLTRTGGLDQLTLPHVPTYDVLRVFYEEQKATEEVRPWLQPLN